MHNPIMEKTFDTVVWGTYFTATEETAQSVFERLISQPMVVTITRVVDGEVRVENVPLEQFFV
jgi:hypothetical protein